MAAALFITGRVKKIFASGGPGEDGVAEGTAMKAYLIKKNIPPDAIIPDNEGRNSYYTAMDFLKLNDSLHFRSAIVVSSYYHLTRAKYIIRKLGYHSVEGVASQKYFWQDGFGMLREFFAFYKYLLYY
jgi:uncharacterized SAM-binding protein YcdF (DUF218 family)